MKSISRFGTLVALIGGLFAINSASAGLLYNPVVTVVGDGTTTGGAGVTTSINVYNNSVAGQPRRSVRRRITAALPALGLVNSSSRNLPRIPKTNNPGISDAAAKGLL